MKKAMVLSAVVAAMVIPDQALAANTGLRQIMNIGCHLYLTTCFVDISGDAVGPASCRSTSIRFDVNSPNGKNILSLLTAAFLAGKQVRFQVRDDTCYAAQPMYPTMSYIHLN